MIPDRRIYLVNWIVTEDHHRQEGDPGVWVHENIDIDEARDVALEVPSVSAEDLARILRPGRCLTLDNWIDIPRTSSSERARPVHSAVRPEPDHQPQQRSSIRQEEASWADQNGYTPLDTSSFSEALRDGSLTR
ncbi:hypothetical protein [Mycolicibacterium setense]|uniref:hypothetical protein n=1 Tax=Mycolicibacterium setense TaxID=431269 RepID=UPI00068FAB8B|nr:hypothetical protein [Mycolicibacterium setense]MCV7115525.1 hypothetical protein [Mycolicibacterium setense]